MPHIFPEADRLEAAGIQDCVFRNLTLKSGVNAELLLHPERCQLLHPFVRWIRLRAREADDALALACGGDNQRLDLQRGAVESPDGLIRAVFTPGQERDSIVADAMDVGPGTRKNGCVSDGGFARIGRLHSIGAEAIRHDAGEARQLAIPDHVTDDPVKRAILVNEDDFGCLGGRCGDSGSGDCYAEVNGDGHTPW